MKKESEDNMAQAQQADSGAADEFPIDMGKVDPAIVNRALKALGLSKEGTFEERVERLKAWTLEPENTPDDALVQCEVGEGGCGAPNNAVKFPDACCFCGKVDKNAEDAAAAAPKVEEEPKPEKPAKAKAEPKAEAPKKQKEEKPAKDKPAPKASGRHLAAVSGEVVNPETEVSEAALDDAIGRVRAAQVSGAQSYWDLGRAVLDIYERRLYTQRKDPKSGKPVYPSWDAFVKAELNLGFSKTHLFTLMDVSKNFDRNTLKELGVAKLQAISRLAPEVRTEMLEKARQGLPANQISDAVKKLVGEGKGSKSTRDQSRTKGMNEARVGKTPNKKAPPKMPAGQLSIAVTSERHKVPLFARPKAGAKDAKPIRAMKIAQDPSGVLELPNGVEMHVRVVLEARGLVAVVEYRKASEKG